MNEPARCPKCGAETGPLAAGGLCPACLLQAGAEAATVPEKPSVFTPPPVEELARRFPQLEILELLGQGGMGAVYKARQPGLDRVVALKILPAQASPGFAERFAREAKAMAKLKHPNIVTIHECGVAGDWHYFIMEYVDGPNLRRLERQGKLSPAEALRIVPQICEALQYAHNQGVVHRDIKPENILLDRDGTVKIADFGIAKLLGHTAAADILLTGARDVVGTPHYMAPEQFEHPQEVDHRADIYSLGVVFYELLTGELPLGKFAPPSRKVEVDVRVDEIVLRALEKEPARRYQHASEVREDVATVSAAPPPAPVVSAAAPAPAAAPSGPPRFSRMAILGAVWIGLALLSLTLLIPLLYISAARTSVDGPPPVVGPNWILIVLSVPLGLAGLSAPLGATILGWIAVARIRKSGGRLTGLGLALFDGLFYPLLALDVVLLLALGVGLRLTVSGIGVAELLIIVLPLVLVIDGFVVWWVWRLARSPAGGMGALWAVLGVGLAAVALLLVATPLVLPLLVWRKAKVMPAVSPTASSPTIRLRSFGADAPVLTPEVARPEDGGWVIAGAPTGAVRLFEVTDPGVEDGVLHYRARIRTEDWQGKVYLEMWCRVDGAEFFSKGPDQAISGAKGWVTCDIPFFLEKGQRPDLIRLNLATEGQGTAHIRDVELCWQGAPPRTAEAEVEKP